MKHVKLSIFILLLLLQACGESEELGWGVDTAKGEAPGVVELGAPCHEVNKEDDKLNLVCTGQLERHWVPSLWHRCFCWFEGQPVWAEKIGPNDCCPTSSQPVQPVDGEGTPCDEIGKKIGKEDQLLTCTAVQDLVLVPHKWTDREAPLCLRTLKGQTFAVGDNATYTSSPWDDIQKVSCKEDGLLHVLWSE